MKPRLVKDPGLPPPLSRRGWLFDAVLALGMGLIAIQAGDSSYEDVPAPWPGEGSGIPVPPAAPNQSVWPPLLPVEEHTTGATVALLLLVVVPLAFRRRYPLGSLWAVLVLAVAVQDDPAALRLSFFACVVAGYSAAVFSPYRLPALASLPVAALLHTALQTDASSVSDGAIPILIMLPIAVAAYGLRRWRTRADEGREKMSTMEHERIEAVRRATEHERARIARELHDVVTHNVSVMVIQAGAARKVMDAAPERAREALLAVEAGGRSAMTELRQVMGLLTMPGDEDDEFTPQPGLDGLDEIVRRTRAAGVPIDLAVTGDRRAVPAGVELAVYRLVQEALTNVVKHAAGARVLVRIGYGDDVLDVEVADTGGHATPATGTGHGHGLIGLRERLAVYDVVLQAGPAPGGGWSVHARIPA